MKYCEIKAKRRWLLLVLMLLASMGPAWAQTTVLELDSAEAQALRRHPRLRQAEQQVNYATNAKVF